MQKTPFKNLSPIDLNRLIQPKSFPPFPDDWIAMGRTLKSHKSGVGLFQSFYFKKNSSFKKGLWIIHGVQEHLGRYVHFSEYLKDDFDYIVGLDHQGHGRSGGARGHVAHFDDFIHDQNQVLLETLSDLKLSGRETTIHLMGHSMGGLIALRWLILYPNLPFQTVTLSGPALGVKAKIPVWKKILGNTINIVWGDFQVPYEVESSVLSHDPAVKEAVDQDQLMIRKASARFYTSFTDALNKTFKTDLRTKIPIQFLVALEDQLVDPGAIKNFESRVQCDTKRIKLYKGFFHEVFNEKSKERAFEDLKQWANLNSSTSSEN